MSYAGTPYAGTPYAGEGDTSEAVPTGTLVGTLPVFEAELLATHVDPPASGALVGSLPSFTGTLLASAPVAGQLVAELPAFEGELQGHKSATAQLVGTDQTYDNLSYSYGGRSWATWETELALPPWEESL